MISRTPIYNHVVLLIYILKQTFELTKYRNKLKEPYSYIYFVSSQEKTLQQRAQTSTRAGNLLINLWQKFLINNLYH